MRVIDLAEVARRMAGQDNLATAHPVFCVQQRRRIYGLDPEYADTFAWLTEDGDAEASPEEAAALTAAYLDPLHVEVEEPSGYHRVAYLDQWVFVQAFLSQQGADRYIEENRHNLTDPRVYVESAYRNDEWQAVRRALLAVGDGEVEDLPPDAALDASMRARMGVLVDPAFEDEDNAAQRATVRELLRRYDRVVDEYHRVGRALHTVRTVARVERATRQHGAESELDAVRHRICGCAPACTRRSWPGCAECTADALDRLLGGQGATEARKEGA